MAFPFVAQLLARIPGWFLIPLWYLAAASVLTAALWRKIQPPPRPVPRPVRITRKVRPAVAYIDDGGITWRPDHLHQGEPRP